MPRWEMEVKCEVSEPVGERMPAGRFSFESAWWSRSSRGGVLLKVSARVSPGLRLWGAAPGGKKVGDCGGGEWLTIVGMGGFEAGEGIRYAFAPGVSAEGKAS